MELKEKCWLFSKKMLRHIPIEIKGNVVKGRIFGSKKIFTQEEVTFTKGVLASEVLTKYMKKTVLANEKMRNESVEILIPYASLK